MPEKLLAAAALLVVLWSTLRFALSLRGSKLRREEARRAEAARGRRVVAEVPTPEGDLALVLEDGAGFYWGASSARKPELVGAELVLNGRALDRAGRPVAQPQAGRPEHDGEGKDRWDVVLHLEGGRTVRVPCGTLREGVSREAAEALFQAARAALGAVGPERASRGPEET